jgi:hypothetical protein
MTFSHPVLGVLTGFVLVLIRLLESQLWQAEKSFLFLSDMVAAEVWYWAYILWYNWVWIFFPLFSLVESHGFCAISISSDGMKESTFHLEYTSACGTYYRSSYLNALCYCVTVLYFPPLRDFNKIHIFMLTLLLIRIRDKHWPHILPHTHILPCLLQFQVTCSTIRTVSSTFDLTPCSIILFRKLIVAHLAKKPAVLWNQMICSCVYRSLLLEPVTS